MPIPRRLLLQKHQTSSTTSASSTPSSTSAPPPNQPLAPDSDVILILAALLCAFICVAGLAFIARCAWLRRRVLRATGRLPSSSSSPPHPPKGIDSKSLQALPKLPFHPDLVTGAAAPTGAETSGKPVVPIAADCAICLTEFAVGDEVRVLPQCGHGFHAACVDAWLKTRSSCPSCRRVLVANDSATHQGGARCDKCGKTAGPARLVAVDGGPDFLP